MKKYILQNNNILPFKFKKLKSGKYFLSNDFGERIILSSDNFDKFISGDGLSKENVDELILLGFMKPNDIDEKTIIKSMAGRWLTRYKYLLNGPSLHIMVVTQQCNHHCIYCHASAKIGSGKNYNMSKKLAKKCIDIIFESTSGDIVIEFQGGEPLVNWDVVKYSIEYARKLNKKYNINLYFDIVSNLTLMDEEKLNFLVADDIGISTSIDGPKIVHDYNRKILGKKGSYDEVINRVNKINEEYEKKGFNKGGLNKKTVGAITTITKKSLKFHKEIVETFLQLGFSKIFVRPLNPFGFAKNVWKNIGYSSEQYTLFYQKLTNYIKKKIKLGNNIVDSYENIIYYNMTYPERINFMEERSPCGAVLGQLAYNWDGGIYTCDEGRMLAAAGDDSFKLTTVDINKKSGEIYKEIIYNNITKIMINASLIDYVPGYDTNPVSNYIGLCPIYSYEKSGNVVSKYKKEGRYRIQEGVWLNLVSNIEKKYISKLPKSKNNIL